MSSKYQPPKFFEDASGYPEYKRKLLRWSRITKVEATQQAEVMLYHLEGHHSGIQEKIDTALGDEIVDKADGLDKVIKFLDGIYAEDEMSLAWSKYKQFTKLKKLSEQSITEFIAEFDRSYSKAKESGCEFSDIVLAFNLLESCQLNKTDEKFVLTAVDFKKGKEQKNLLEQVKNSLRKFNSRDRLAGDRDSSSRMQVKQEEEIYFSVETLIANGWRPPTPGGGGTKKKGANYKGKKNTLGTDGKPLRCFKCQSEFHFADRCDQKVVPNCEKPEDTQKSAQKSSKTMLSNVLAKSKSSDYYSMVCTVEKNLSERMAEPSKMMLSEVLAKPKVDCELDVNVDAVCIDEFPRTMLSDLLARTEVSNSKECEAVHDSKDEVVLVLVTNVDEEETIQESSKTMLSDLLNINTEVSNTEVSGTVEGIELVLVTHNEEEMCLLVEDAGCRGVLDSACSKTVTGLKWIDKYSSSVSPTFAEKLEVSASTKVYQFGGGEKRKSQGCIHLPTVIGDKKVFILVDIVDASIPLLIGSNSMELGGAILNFKSSSAIFFEEEVPMHKVSTGHFCIDLVSENLETYINDVDERHAHIIDVLITSDHINIKELKKLHHYYGHVDSDKLLKFLKNAGKETSDLRKGLKEIEKSCDSCIRTKKRKPRPQTAIPRAEGPNQIVSLDLKQWKGPGEHKFICYMIDMYSRLTLGGFIPDKKPDSVVNCIMNTWFVAFGRMAGLHSDIGGEFSNDLLEDVAHKLGVKLTTTSSYSPHQNGLNERNHTVVDLMITRMMCSDNTLTPEMALSWGLSAKNSLENNHGFSPFQLHIGQNPVFPSIIRDGPPSFEEFTKSASFAAHLNAMHSAREEFVKAESSSRLKKALKSKLHTRGDDITEGDWIYFKKRVDRDTVWKGPSKVVSTNGKKLFIDQGARLGTVNRDDAVRIGEEFWNMSDLQKDSSSDDHTKTVDDITLSDSSETDEDEVSDLPEMEETGENENVTTEEAMLQEVNTYEEEEESEVLSEDDDVVSTERGAEVLSFHGVTLHDSDNNDQVVHSDEDLSLVCDESVSASGPSNELHSFKDVKIGDVITYQIPESGIVETSVIQSSGGKRSAANRYWWNVEVLESGNLSGVTKSINAAVMNNLIKENINVKNPVFVPSLVVTIPRHQHNEPECIEAKETELKNWEDFGVFKEVADIGQKTVNTNWVLIKKSTGVKARLCVRGDQELGKETIRTDSPTINKVNVKLFYVMAGHFGWDIKTADVKAAFLQGTELDRDVFVRPPKERRVPGVIWKMVKRAYGFVDASRGFYLELNKVLLELGCKVSSYEPAMYMYFGQSDSNLLKGLLLTHVDDFLRGTGDSEFDEHILTPLKERFLFGQEDDHDFKYIGMHVVKEGSAIVTDQDHYIDSIDVPDWSPSGSDLDELLNEYDQSEFRSIVGRIGWVAKSSRPDLSYDNLVLSLKVGKASQRDMKMAIKIIKKMKCEGTSIKFVDLGAIAEWTIEGFGDAGFRSMPDRTTSCGGCVILISNKSKGLSSVLNWKSNKLKRVVSSSTAAEALAANDALDEMVYIKCILTELLGSAAENIHLDLFTDSKNLHDSVNSSTLADNPRLRTDIAKLKDSVECKELHAFGHVKGKKMLADLLTKKGAPGYLLMDILRTGKS